MLGGREEGEGGGGEGSFFRGGRRVLERFLDYFRAITRFSMWNKTRRQLYRVGQHRRKREKEEKGGEDRGTR